MRWPQALHRTSPSLRRAWRPLKIGLRPSRHGSVLAALGGRCPCCGLARVLDDGGRVVGADFDHYYSRERRDFTETWLICRPCHRRMTDRTQFASAFEAYQQRADSLEVSQLVLL